MRGFIRAAPAHWYDVQYSQRRLQAQLHLCPLERVLDVRRSSSIAQSRVDDAIVPLELPFVFGAILFMIL